MNLVDYLIFLAECFMAGKIDVRRHAGIYALSYRDSAIGAQGNLEDFIYGAKLYCVDCSGLKDVFHINHENVENKHRDIYWEFCVKYCATTFTLVEHDVEVTA